MLYQTEKPVPALEPFVDCLWLLEGPASDEPSEPEIVLPDGRTELIVHFGDAFCKWEGQGFVEQARVLVSGQLTERILLKPTGRVGVVSVRFLPAGAARFFDLPYEDLVDQVADFSTYEGALAQKLHDEIARAPTADARISVMQENLTQLLKRESEEDVVVRQACRYIMKSEGEYSVQELVKLIGYSERQLERKFKKQVGLTPKVLSRIMRFQKFLALTKQANDLTLAGVAHACGYYDQSHFIRDFTRFSGVSPLSYLGSSHELSDHFTGRKEP